MTDHSEPENPSPGATDALAAFMEAFGNMDIYAQIVMEEFMEALLNDE